MKCPSNKAKARKSRYMDVFRMAHIIAKVIIDAVQEKQRRIAASQKLPKFATGGIVHGDWSHLKLPIPDEFDEHMSGSLKDAVEKFDIPSQVFRQPLNLIKTNPNAQRTTRP